MKCRIIVHDAEGPDPQQPGKSVPVPVGTEIEHPDCWYLCVPNGEFKVYEVDGRQEFKGAPRILAEPVDDECKARVEAERARMLAARTANPEGSKFKRTGK